MHPIERHRLGGQLLAVGAGLSLLLKIYSFFLSQLGTLQHLTIPYMLIGDVFGFWLATLITPGTVEGKAIEFSLTQLLYVPRAAVFIIFLLWSALKILKGEFNRVSYTVLAVLGLWLLVGLIYHKVSFGFDYLQSGFPWILLTPLRDLRDLAMIIGISIVYASHKQAQSVNLDDQYSKDKMTFWRILFSLDGRINRAKFWPYIMLLNVITSLPAFIIDFSKALAIEIGAFYGLCILICFWPALALNVKRCHDRDQSGWFCLVGLVPIVNFWYLVDIGFLKGTDGDNRFGPDPLGQT